MQLLSIKLSSQPGHWAAFWLSNTGVKEDICNPNYFMAKHSQMLPSQQKLCGNVMLASLCGREQGTALHSVLMLLVKHNPAEGLFSTAEFRGGLAECAGSEGTNAIV